MGTGHQPMAPPGNGEHPAAVPAPAATRPHLRPPDAASWNSSKPTGVDPASPATHDTGEPGAINNAAGSAPAQGCRLPRRTPAQLLPWDGTAALIPTASPVSVLLLGSSQTPRHRHAALRPLPCRALRGGRGSPAPLPSRHLPFPFPSRDVGSHAPTPCPQPGTAEPRPQLPAALVQLHAPGAARALQSVFQGEKRRARAATHPCPDRARTPRRCDFALSASTKQPQGHGRSSSGSVPGGFPKPLPPQQDPHPGCTRERALLSSPSTLSPRSPLNWRPGSRGCCREML